MEKSVMMRSTSQLFKAGVLLFLVSGVLLTGLHIYNLAQYSFVDATVQASTSVAGKCRLRMGKYIDCERSVATVSYQLPGSLSPRTGELDTGEYWPPVGAPLKVMVRADDPASIRLATLSKGWAVPLGTLCVGLLGLIIHCSRRDRASTVAAS